MCPAGRSMDVWDLPWGGRARRVSFWKSFEEAPCGFEPDGAQRRCRQKANLALIRGNIQVASRVYLVLIIPEKSATQYLDLQDMHASSALQSDGIQNYCSFPLRP